AKYSHHDGRMARNVKARNHRTSAASTALVQVHSKSRTNVSARAMCGRARSWTPFGKSLIVPVAPGRMRPDYIDGSRGASNMPRFRVARPPGAPSSGGAPDRLVKPFTSFLVIRRPP